MIRIAAVEVGEVDRELIADDDLAQRQIPVRARLAAVRHLEAHRPAPGVSIREMLRENPSINAIKAEARKNGMIYLHEDGLRQVFQGHTSIDELRRIVG